MDKRIKEYVDELIEEEKQNVHYKYDALSCQSQTFTPIEQLLFFAFRYYLDGFKVHPQFQIGRFRVDFMIQADSNIDGWDWSAQIVIECDGHDFHERTKQQAAADKSRDRELQRLGFYVMRFTGSEIWKDPSNCAEEVHAFICDLREREWRKKHEGKKN